MNRKIYLLAVAVLLSMCSMADAAPVNMAPSPTANLTPAQSGEYNQYMLSVEHSNAMDGSRTIAAPEPVQTQPVSSDEDSITYANGALKKLNLSDGN